MDGELSGRRGHPDSDHDQISDFIKKSENYVSAKLIQMWWKKTYQLDCLMLGRECEGEEVELSKSWREHVRAMKQHQSETLSICL